MHELLRRRHSGTFALREYISELATWASIDAARFPQRNQYLILVHAPMYLKLQFTSGSWSSRGSMSELAVGCSMSLCADRRHVYTLFGPSMKLIFSS